MLRSNQTKTPHFPQPAGSIHGFGWHILQALKRNIHPTPPCAAGLWSPFQLPLAWQTPPHKTEMPTEPSPERTAASQPSTRSCLLARRSDDEDTQASRGLSGLPFPSEVASGLRPTQPPTAKVEEGTHLSARILHTLAPSTLPARAPREEGIIKQTSQPPTTCGFYIYTNVLLEMGAQHPGTQEKSSRKQNASGRLSAPEHPAPRVSRVCLRFGAVSQHRGK